MASYIAFNQMGKAIDTHKETEDTWPLIKFFPNREHVKLCDSPFKAFEINQLIVIKNEQIEHSSELKIVGKSEISVKCFEKGHKVADKGGKLITENFNIVLDLTCLKDTEIKIAEKYEVDDHTSESKTGMNLGDQEVTNWKKPSKIAYNSEYVIIYRKANQTIKNWADQFSSLEFDQKADFNFELDKKTKVEKEEIDLTDFQDFIEIDNEEHKDEESKGEEKNDQESKGEEKNDQESKGEETKDEENEKPSIEEENYPLNYSASTQVSFIYLKKLGRNFNEMLYAKTCTKA